MWIIVFFPFSLIVFTSYFYLGITKSNFNSTADSVVYNHNESSNEHRKLLFGSSSCSDPKWCDVPMPTVSYFRFPTPPDDIDRWNKAKQQAAAGEPVLLRKIVKYFPHYFDFLDGDVLFRSYHLPADYFLDDNHGFEVLSKSYAGPAVHSKLASERNVFGQSHTAYSWQKGHASVIPPEYDLRLIDRAPVLHLGYFAFTKDGASASPAWFKGASLGEAVVDRNKFYRLWQVAKQKQQIDRPWIGLHSANENWGLLSTFVPNRTANWGSCCHQDAKDKMIYEILNDNMTMMLFVNQHYNLTHPKLLPLPRGLPILGEHNRRIIWDLMHYYARQPELPNSKEKSSRSSQSSSQNKRFKKDQLLFTASSNWGYRPKILECLMKKSFDPLEVHFNAHQSEGKQGRMTQIDYYGRLVASKFSVALPGLGYDTFRLWEALVFGTIPIIERGIGLDKTLWRLPALLVNDYDDITPQLLRTAYLEALYRVEEFEFERLQQSWWWSFLMQVSLTKSVDTILAKFPPESEDPNFARPFQRYTCHESNSCGKGTKRIPKSIC